MWKKIISIMLMFVLQPGMMPMSAMYDIGLDDNTSGTVSVQETTEETFQPTEPIAEATENTEVSDVSEDEDASEDTDTQDTLTDFDIPDNFNDEEDLTPRCAFSFNSPLQRAADESIVKSTGGETDIEINTLRASLRLGAELKENGDYVWTADNSAADHTFKYRFSYSLSGTYEYEPGGIEFRVPKSILLNRDGQSSDQYEMSVPHEDEKGLTDSNPFVYKEETDENGETYLVVYNRISVPAGQSGYIEIAYHTLEKTFEYADYDPNYVGQDGKNDKHGSNPFYVKLKINQNDVTKEAESDKIPVCIDTTAKIENTRKNASSYYTEWQSSWGTAPADADKYYYLIWEVRTRISPCTQPYDFSLVDKFDVEQGEVVGYRMQDQSQTGYISAENGGGVLKNLKTEYIYGRYDYVLTRHSKSYYENLTKYTVRNNVTAKVHPVDGVDNDTTAEANAKWSYEKPVFRIPVGHFDMYKCGLDYSDSENSAPDHPRRFDLEDYKNKDINTIPDLAFETCVYGYPYPWTVPKDKSMEDPNNYGEEPVTFELTDNELYLKALGQDYPTDKLTKDDYQFDKIKLYWEMKDAVYDETYKEFKATSVKYTKDDVISVYAQFNGGEEWVDIGSYDIPNNKFTLTEAAKTTYGASASGTTLSFSNTENKCTGYRLLTTNKHYYTALGANPYVTLKRTDAVTKAVDEAYESSREIALKNQSCGKAYDGDSTSALEIFSKTAEGVDYVLGIDPQGEINKSVIGYRNDKINRQYSVTWSVNASESYQSDGGRKVYVKQESGKFYDLLPAGGLYKNGSVAAYADGKKLSPGQYTVSTVPNYKGSGRTMLIVDYESSADVSYSFSYTSLHPWNSAVDYGKDLHNSVAYETGNTQIGGGRPDDGGPDDDDPDGGSIEDKELMKDLDPNTDDKKFLYAQADHTMNMLVYTTTGLDKKVKAEYDNAYSYKTFTYEDSTYSYNLRFATDDATKAKDLIFFDSLENYETKDGKTSDWHGTFESIDLSQAKKMGVAPVVYYSEISNLDLEKNHDLSNGDVWKILDGDTDPKNVCAIAVDLSKDTNGNDFVLPKDSSLTATVYMRSPKASEIKSDSTDPTAYNNIYRYCTEISVENGESSPSLVHQDFTQLHYRVVGDLKLQKRDSSNVNTPVEGITFRLQGKSYYGTEVDRLVTTPATGNISFEHLERGEYSLQEVYGVDDYLPNHTKIKVTVNDEGEVTVDLIDYTGKASINEDGSYTVLTVLNDPRIHGDLKFVKKGSVDGEDYLKRLKDVKFRLTGTSAYGNEIVKYAVSDSNGTVIFDNVEMGNNYIMEEFVAADGYICSQTKYSVKCDNNGVLSISYTDGDKDIPIQQDKSGDYVIINEPYHSFKLWKKDAVNNESLQGAKFELEGTSDYGTPTDITITTDSNGIAEFTGLEPGKYVLKEVEAPAHHNLDKTPRRVIIESDGTVTIDGITFDETFKWFPVDNERTLEGVITVTKQWENDQESDRSIPVIHIDSEEPNRKLPIATISRDSWNSDAMGLLQSATSFSRNTELTLEQVKDKSGAKKIDDGTTDRSVYVWMEGDAAYWWSDADIIYFPEDCSDMFSWCTNLTSLDVSGFDTSNVTNMRGMFYNCSELGSLNVSGFDTSNVTDMSNMFGRCYKLTELNLGDFDTREVKNMSSMFANCYKLASLDLINSNFDTSKVKDMNYMFAYCKKLTELNLGGFDTSEVTDMSYMFVDCENLQELNLTGLFNTSNVTNMSCMFSGCYGLPSLDLSNFKTGKVTNMSHMFDYCYGLESLNVSGFDTREVTDMGGMFIYCSGLTSLDVSGFDTSIVENMRAMFSSCSCLTSLDLSSFNTGSVTDMGYMFSDCSGLTELNLTGKFKTRCVEDMSSMFSQCYNLSSLYGVSDFDTSSVKNMNSMFFSCKNLAELDLSKFKTGEVTNMNSMFMQCYELASLDVSGFDTSKVTDMNGMFQSCKILTSLDLSSFDTSKVTDMGNMFFQSRELKTIYVGNDWNTDIVTSSNSMFYKCTAIVGGQGTTYNSSYTDKSYAHVDGGTNNPGYFTSKVSTANTNDESTYSLFRSDGIGLSTVISSAYDGVSNIINSASDGAASLMEFTENTFKLLASTTFVLADSILELADAAAVSPTSATDGENSVSVNYTSKSEMYDPAVDGEDTENVLEKWIDNGDGTWTYRFKVYDENAEYYLWEEALAGYTSDHSADNPLKIIYNTQGGGCTPQPVVTNTKEENPKASLKISKTVTGNGATDEDRNTEFSFNIQLSQALAGWYGDILFEDGVANVSLKHGETITAVNLPDGITYEVTELDANQNSFITTSTGEKGTLENGKSSIAAFENSKDGPPKPQTGELKISKTVKSTDGGEPTDSDTQRDFLFTITFCDSEGNVDTNIDGLYGDVIFTLGTAQTSLKHNESKNITGIPAGIYYKVEEADYSKSFACEKEGDTGIIAGNTVQNAEFTNTKKQVATNGFTLTKKLLGVQPEKPFTFYIAFTGLEPMTVYKYTNGEFTSEKDGSAKVTVELSPNERVHFDGLPVGSTYTVTELESKYVASYTVTNSASGGAVASTGGSNYESETALETGVEKVDEDEDITITYTNTSPSFEVSFAKKDIQGVYLDGAKLQVLDERGNVVTKWESSGELDVVKLPAGSYRLHEANAPDGYSNAEDIAFTISETGVLTVDGKTDAQTFVEMIDYPTEIKISKQDGYQNPLSGAMLQLTDDTNGDIVDTWTSLDSESKNFNQKLNIFTPYTLHEISAPDGYAKAQDIHFILNGSGQVIINGELSRKQDGSYTVLGGTPAEDNLIVMNDYKKIVLPGSGSKEELMFMLFGCLLFTAGCIYIGRYYLKRRRRLR